MSSSALRFGGVFCAAFILVGCAVKQQASTQEVKKETPPPGPVACVAAQEGSPLVGTWFAVSTPRGVAGNLQSLTVLSPDGKMTYETQLKIGKKIRPALRESGCWSYVDGVYTMQTTQSYGEPVDISDPIYSNKYRVQNINGKQAKLLELKPGGQTITATKMSPNYRLP